MGRQFRIYLLPADLDRLLSEIKTRHGLRILSAESSEKDGFEVDSATSQYQESPATGFFSFGRFYLAPAFQSALPIRWLEYRQLWGIDSDRAEVVELSTCDHGRGMLREGRFFYQIDMLSPTNDSLLKKDSEFVQWAEAIFSTSKRLLTRSAKHEAYIGTDTQRWHSEGGKFVNSFELLPKSKDDLPGPF